ncbi:MAG: hypothetical protein AABX19_01955 [Nanoarchaeota archaeon]
MDKKFFYDALDNSDPNTLEDLAISSGYTYNFNPLTTDFMLGEAERHFYWTNNIFNNQFLNRREYWNNTYSNAFTRTKKASTSEYFVDCWTIRENKKLVISTGEFPAGDLDGDRDSLKADFLFRVRNQNYFPKNGPLASVLVVGSFTTLGTNSVVIGLAAGVLAGILTHNRLRLDVPFNRNAIDYIFEENDIHNIFK